MAINPVSRARATHQAPIAERVKAFLTAGSHGQKAIAEQTDVGWLLNDTRLNTHGIFTGAAQGWGTPKEQRSALALLKTAPKWIQTEAKNPLAVHRLAVFDLPGPGNHKVWFVETESYKAGFFVDGEKHPSFIFEPGQFRPAKANETLWPGRR